MNRFDRNKFKALVHYVCDKAADSTVLSSVKLNKVLWYADSIHYMITGQSISGETYIKRQHGPVPRHIVGIVDELVRERKIARSRIDHSKSEVTPFTSEQIELIDAAFDHVFLSPISEETHGVIWQIAKMEEEIPLATVFASDVGEVDETNLEWASQHITLAA